MKKKIQSITLLVLLLFGVFIYSGNAQDKHSWLELGLGYGSIHDFNRAAFMGQFTIQRGQNLFSIRGLALTRPMSGGMYDRTEEIGVLYGRSLLSPYIGLKFSLAGGVSLGRVATEEDMEIALGIPLEAKIAFRISRSFGMAFSAYGNLNTVESYYGALLCFQFGKR